MGGLILLLLDEGGREEVVRRRETVEENRSFFDGSWMVCSLRLISSRDFFLVRW